MDISVGSRDPPLAAILLVAATRSRRHMSAVDNDTNERMRRKRAEIFAFLFLTVVVMPALAVATVGGYGFTVWIYQMIAGPPGPPSR